MEAGRVNESEGRLEARDESGEAVAIGYKHGRCRRMKLDEGPRHAGEEFLSDELLGDWKARRERPNETGGDVVAIDRETPRPQRARATGEADRKAFPMIDQPHGKPELA